MLVSSLVDRGIIGGVMVSALASSLVDCGFIGGVIVSVLASSAIDCGFIGGEVYLMNVVLLLTLSVPDKCCSTFEFECIC